MSETKQNRNDFQVMRDILVAASSGALKTHIIFKANSNNNHVRGFLQQALKSGLLTESGGMFWITPKGEEFVVRVFECELILGCSYGSA